MKNDSDFVREVESSLKVVMDECGHRDRRITELEEELESYKVCETLMWVIRQRLKKN
jgi:hypothetical protein